MGGWEILTGILAGGVGFAAADVLDRFLATRDRGKDAQGNLLPTGPAVPISTDILVRGGAGVAVAAAPLIAAHFISSPMWRSGLQFFGFGALFNLVGKGINELGAYLFKDSPADSTGRKLFSNDIDLLKAAGVQGLGAEPGCPTCGRRDGLGACCRSQLPSGPSTGVDRGWRQNMDGTVTPPPAMRAPISTVTAPTPTPTPEVPPPAYVPPTAVPTPTPRLPTGGNGGFFQPPAAASRATLPVAVAGLGAAQEALVRNQAAYNAVQQHAAGIRELSQFSPETLAAAAHGLGMVPEAQAKPTSPRFTASSRWSREKD